MEKLILIEGTRRPPRRFRTNAPRSVSDDRRLNPFAEPTATRCIRASCVPTAPSGTNHHRTFPSIVASTSIAFTPLSGDSRLPKFRKFAGAFKHAMCNLLHMKRNRQRSPRRVKEKCIVYTRTGRLLVFAYGCVEQNQTYLHAKAHSDIPTKSCPSSTDTGRAPALPVPQAMERMLRIAALHT